MTEFEQRPFYRVFQLTQYEAAIQQIDAAIEMFSAGRFAASITLAGAAEGMASQRDGGLWQALRDHPKRPIPDTKKWTSRLNETRDWLKHQKDDPARNLISVEAGFMILRAMDKWDPWSPTMSEFYSLWVNSPKLMRPEDYDRWEELEAAVKARRAGGQLG